MKSAVSAFERFGARPRLLLVASTGGHLTQLTKLTQTVDIAESSVWVSFDSPQSRSLLRGKRTVWVDYVAPRDLRGTLRAARKLDLALKSEEFADVQFDGVVSTGAAVAVAGFLWGRRQGIPCSYIESVSRTNGPSVTGKIVHALRLANPYTQHERWASPRWPRTHSVLEGFSSEPRTEPIPTHQPLKVLVTLGTIRPYRFDRLVDRVLSITDENDSIVWQLGETSRQNLPGEVHELMAAEDLLRAARAADVVITHSGVGTILQLLDEGIAPVVVPRKRQHGEHVDDHQLQIWQLLTNLEVSHPTKVKDLTRETLLAAASHRTVPQPKDGFHAAEEATQESNE